LRVLLALCLLATGCAPTASSPSADPDSFLGEWQNRLPAILEQASPFERELLSDGTVTPAEHERAQLAYVDCIEQGGVRITSFATYDNGLVREASFSMERDDVEAILADCESLHYTYVPEAYRISLTPNDSAAKVAARTARCMADAGIEVDPSPADVGVLAQSVLTDPDAGAAMTECYEAVKFDQ